MKYKANFKTIILIHLIGIIVLGALFSVVGPANGNVLKWITGTLFISFVLQLLIYTFKPAWFGDKVKKHPDAS